MSEERAPYDVEDATNPVCNPEAAEDARQQEVRALGLKTEQRERQAAWQEHVLPVPSARLMTGRPSPGHEAEQARREVAALAAKVAALEAEVRYLNSLPSRVEALETRGAVAPPTAPSGPESALRALDAAFVTGFELGHWGKGGITDSDVALERWIEGGRKTHLDEP